jgi:hypothetical protein
LGGLSVDCFFQCALLVIFNNFKFSPYVWIANRAGFRWGIQVIFSINPNEEPEAKEDDEEAAEDES